MNKPAKVILLIAVVLTTLAFWHDYTYDVPSVPYTTGGYIAEILIMGPLFVAFFFGVIYGVYALLRGLMRIAS